MTLVDDLQGESTTEWSFANGGRAEYADALAEIATCGMESASSLAAVHAAELRLLSVAAALDPSEAVSEEHAATLARAREALTGVGSA